MLSVVLPFEGRTGELPSLMNPLADPIVWKLLLDPSPAVDVMAEFVGDGVTALLAPCRS